jgi:hypothetical protein
MVLLNKVKQTTEPLKKRRKVQTNAVVVTRETASVIDIADTSSSVNVSEDLQLSCLLTLEARDKGTTMIINCSFLCFTHYKYGTPYESHKESFSLVKK